MFINQFLNNALVVCTTEAEAVALLQAAAFFKYDTKAIYLPALEQLPYSGLPVKATNIIARIKALNSLYKAIKAKQRFLLITTLPGILHKIMPLEHYKKLILSINVSDKASFNSLLETLVALGFTRHATAINAAEFAVRGSLIDIAIDDTSGVRIDFLGQKIEAIRLFDTITQKTYDKINFYEIVAPIDLPIWNIESFEENFYRKFGPKHLHYIDAVKESQSLAGLSYLSPLFGVPHKSIIKILKDEKIEFTLHTPALLDAEYNSLIAILERNYNKRVEDKTQAILPLGQIYCTLEEIKIQAQSDLKPLQKMELYHCQHNQKGAISLIKNYQATNSKPLLIAMTSNTAIERFLSLSKDHDITPKVITDFTQIRDNQYVYVTLLSALECFQTEQFISINEETLFGHKIGKKPKATTNASEIFQCNALENGDLVVHIDHGIGRFNGITTITVANKPRDFIELHYALNSKFFLPVENFEMLTKHGDNNAHLDKLGSSSWQERKANIKNRIKLAAQELMKTAAKRAISTSDALEYDKLLYNEFCSKFEYIETPDQLKAIDDIIKDFGSDKPMDRLICADVGFGKTEVAMRAVFLVLASKAKQQAAILVPTTLLARQHYANFKERFGEFGIKVAQLSKFTPHSQIKTIKQGLKDGTVDIVIGTQSLLAKDIEFANLGIVVIDEEQHFGVKQKERLKELKSNCHILTLSATPIPRTLQMSLCGIKDLSIIATPPQNRLPIKTNISAFDELVIQEAIMREIERGGRAFIVTPRIANIERLQNFMHTSMPKVRAIAADGSLSATKLDDIMNKFYDGTYSVLIATNIIESGLDIQAANTIIIDNAHYFGLAQLYQIRGRVGRSNTQAYAYLTYPPNTILSQEAKKRLHVMESVDMLGAGFNIASNDMDLRGYGNIVGEEQSGHIKEVGFELYQQMLQQALYNLKGCDIEDEWTTSINIDIALGIPESYIEDGAVRLSMFRRLAGARDSNKLEQIQLEMLDRFGNLPPSTVNLIKVLEIKLLAKELMISKIDCTQNLLITFKSVNDKLHTKILDMMQKNPDIKLRPENKIFIPRNWEDDDLKLKNILNLLRHILPNTTHI